MPKHRIGPGDRLRLISETAWTDADLLAAVRRLAADADAQEEWLRRIGTWPLLDELALEFADEFARVRDWPDEALPQGALVAMRELDARLEEMSGEQNAELWEPPALIGSEWRHVREIAGRAEAALSAAR